MAGLLLVLLVATAQPPQQRQGGRLAVSPSPRLDVARGGLAPRRPETRWYTSAGSRGQLSDEAGHLTGVFPCCTGFAIFPNASFTCPDAAGFAKRNFGGPNATFTVDHVISICRGCDAPGSGVPFDWHAAKAGIPAMVECADAGNITGFVIDWEPPARARCCCCCCCCCVLLLLLLLAGPARPPACRARLPRPPAAACPPALACCS